MLNRCPALLAAYLRGALLIAAIGAAGVLVWLLVAEPCSDTAQILTGTAGVGGSGQLSVTGALTGVCAWAALGCAGWLALSTSLTVVETVLTATRSDTATTAALAGLTRSTCPRFARSWVRRLVLAGAGVALGAGVGVPASADPAGPSSPQGPAGTTRSVAGLILPDRAHDRGSGARREAVIVRRGDSLWTIAAALSSQGAGVAQLDTRWRELYRLNRREVGPDPDLIHPGDRLRVRTPPRKDCR